MNTENIMKIVEKVIEMGCSREHYASLSLSMSPNTFPVSVNIHNLDSKGLPAGLADRKFFYNVDTCEVHRDWLNHWVDRIREEREND